VRCSREARTSSAAGLYASSGGARLHTLSVGGYRVIYYAKTAQRVIWMLTMYPKNVADNIPAQVLRQIRKEVEDG
jgi:hypothetical protein